MDNANSILKLVDLSIGYGGDPLVSSINASAGQGQFIVLFGANGKGKSTLLKTISGQVDSQNGEVFILDRSAKQLNLKEVAKLISFIPGNLSMPSEVTVFDLLKYARIPYLTGLKRVSSDDHEMISSVVDELGISELLNKSYMTLSDGQKQQVNIARSLVQDTQIIALDEPTAHLDVVNRRKVFQTLKEQVKKGKLVICCTHDLYEGSSYADEVWLINKLGEFEVVQSKTEISVNEMESKLF